LGETPGRLGGLLRAHIVILCCTALWCVRRGQQGGFGQLRYKHREKDGVPGRAVRA